MALHNTAAEAEAASRADLEHHTPDSGDLWHEDIGVLSWGEMVRHGEARCVERGSPPEGAPSDDRWEVWVLVRTNRPATVPALVADCLVDIFFRMGGPDCDGWDSPEDAWGLAREALVLLGAPVGDAEALEAWCAKLVAAFHAAQPESQG